MSESSNGFFVVNQNGEVYLSKDPLLASFSVASINVEVSDGYLSDYITLIVPLINLNIQPIFTNIPATIPVPENASSSIVFTISVADPDPIVQTSCTVYPSSEAYKLNITTRNQNKEQI